MNDKNEQQIQTLAIHADRKVNGTRGVTAPIWQTTTYAYESPEEFAAVAGQVNPSEFYTRFGNPTHAQVAAVVARLEGGEAALVTSTGMGAIFAVMMSNLKMGDHVIAQKNHYAGAGTILREWLPRFGIEVTEVDQTNIEEFAAAVRQNTKLIYVETPSNPLMRLTDLQEVARIGRKHKITTVVDGTFATPINQQPLAFGIDAVVHSGTKYFGGHHDLMAGVIVGTKQFIEQVWHFTLIGGSILSPFDGWLLLRGLRTLGLRVERHNSSALAVARFLESHPKIERVYYPGLESHPQHELARVQMRGFTGMLAVEVCGGFKAAQSFCKRLKIAVYAGSLGGVDTLVVHPAAMWSHELSEEQRLATGVSESLVRISVGLEGEQDLIGDFAQALETLCD
jgi:methionine-gamma-lyase